MPLAYSKHLIKVCVVVLFCFVYFKIQLTTSLII